MLAVVCIYLIAVPILLLLWEAITVQSADQAHTGQEAGALTFYYFKRIFFSAIAGDVFWNPVKNTLIVTTGSVVCALMLGMPLAFLLARTDLPGRKWFSTALLVPYILPSWIFALAWMTLFKNWTTGGQSGWIESFGFMSPDWLAYGMLPIMVILSLHYMPFVILLLGNGLRQFDSSLEDSAHVIGAGKWLCIRKIILPLMLPAIVSASTLIFAKCPGDFGVAYILGVPVGFNVLATSIFRAISTSRTGMSAMLAATIVVLGSLSVFLDIYLLRQMHRFVMIGNKGTMSRLESLGRCQLLALLF